MSDSNEKWRWTDEQWREYMSGCTSHEEWEERSAEQEAAWKERDARTRADAAKYPWKYTVNLGAAPVHPPHAALWTFQYDDWQENGLPKCESLTRELGLSITPSMRDAIWADYYNGFERRDSELLPVAMSWEEIAASAQPVDTAAAREEARAAREIRTCEMCGTRNEAGDTAWWEAHMAEHEHKRQFDIDRDPLVRELRMYAEEEYHGAAHVRRWKSALTAIGDDTGERAMTLAEAQDCYRRFSKQRWGPVVKRLGGDQDSLVRELRMYAEEEHHGAAHVRRWKSALTAIGHDTGERAMTLTEAQDCYRRFSKQRWGPVVKRLGGDSAAVHSPPARRPMDAGEYAYRLARARECRVLTEEEFTDRGGSSFAQELGLWVAYGINAAGVEIIPYAWQVENVRRAGDKRLIDRLFRDLGRAGDIEKYEAATAQANADRQKWGYVDC